MGQGHFAAVSEGVEVEVEVGDVKVGRFALRCVECGLELLALTGDTPFSFVRLCF